VLQQALQQRCGAASARVVAALRRCCKLAATAKSNAMARRPVLAVKAGGPTLLCSDGRRPEFLFLFFFKIFYSTVSKREQKQDREKRDRASKPVSRLCWLA